MQRTFFFVLGLLGLVAGGILLSLGFLLPTSSDVDQHAHRAEQVASRTGDQIVLLRRQIETARRPEMQELAERLHEQLPQLTQLVKSQGIDYDNVRNVNKAVGDLAAGLEGMAQTLDPENLGQMREGLKKTASFLDEKVIPAATTASERLDKTTADLRTDAQRLSELLKVGSPDLKAAREIHNSLGRFNEGLDQLANLIKPERIEAMREGFKGMESSLTTGAEQVEKLSGYNYPVVTFNGLKPNVEQKPFWPEGGKIAEGLRKGAKGLSAAGKDLEDLFRDLPKLRTALLESRKVADQTREALGKAIKDQDKLEPLLKNIPKHSAQLAAELPLLTSELSKILRETSQLREVATALRQAGKGLDMAVENWPQLRKALLQSAMLLKNTQQQLDRALENRQKYERTINQTLDTADLFASALPLYTAQLENRLAEQDRSLNDLENSVGEVRSAIPVMAQGTTRILTLARWGLWVFAAIMLLLGSYLCTLVLCRKSLFARV